MSIESEVLERLKDGDAWTTASIASAVHVPAFLLEKTLMGMTTGGGIQFDGLRDGQKTWRAMTVKSRQPHLDEQVDAILKSSTDGSQPNDMTQFTPPDGDKHSPELSLVMPFGEGWSDEPHWKLDAMGWVERLEDIEDGLEVKSPPPWDSPIRWMGGKSKMLKDLINWYPDHHCYVECFGGSLKPFFAKAPSKIEVVNDFYTELVNFWRIASQWPEALADACNGVPASRTMHRLFQRNDGRRTPWERAVMFGALVRFSFNGKPWSSFGGSPSAPPTTINKDLLVKCAQRLSDPGVYIENLDFRVLIDRYNKKMKQGDVFFYLDPPYLDTAGYNDAFPDEWHQELAEKMIEIHDAGNKVLMTNSPQAMAAYKKWLGVRASDFWFESYTVKYSAAGAASGRGDVEETIISNFKLKVSSQRRQATLL